MVWELLGDENRTAWFSVFVLVLRRLAQWSLLPGRRILFTRSRLYKTTPCEDFYYYSRSVLLSVRRPMYNFDPLSQLSWYEFDHVTVKHPIPIRPDKTKMIGRSVLTFSGGSGVIVSEDVCANAPGPCYLVRLDSGKYLPCYHGNVFFLDKPAAA